MVDPFEFLRRDFERISRALGPSKSNPKIKDSTEKPIDIRSIYKDIQVGRTRRGSLISKTNDRVHLEIIHHEDMQVVSGILNQLTKAGIPYTTEHKKVHSPRDRGYVNAIVIEYDDIKQFPLMGLE